MNKSYLSLAMLSALSYCSLTYAESVPVDETMVITANRFEQPVATVLAPMSIVTKDDIAQLQVTNALDVLKSLPGVEIVQQGGKAQVSSIFLRGTSSRHTLVLLDGVKINSSTVGGASLGLIPAFAIEQIEVVRGPRAAVYGSDAIGGVIHIKTIAAKPRTEHNLHAGYGNNDHSLFAWRSMGEINQATRASFVVANEKSNGYRINELAPEQDTHGFRSQTLFGHVRHDINQEWFAQFNGYQLTSDVDYANQFTGIKNESNVDFYSISGSLNLKTENYFSQLMLSRSDDKSWDGDASGSSARTALSSNRQSISWLNRWQVIPALGLSTGVDYEREKANRGGANSSNYIETDKDNKAAYITAQVIYDGLSAEASLRHDDHNTFGNHTTWNVGLGISVSQYLEVIASSGTGFKAPTFNDLYWPDSGNKDLKPETSKSVEVGLRGYLPFMQWEISAYRNDIDDMIAWAPAGVGGAWIPSNINNARIKGLEVEALFETGPLTHRLVAEWKDPRDKADNSLLIRNARENFSWRTSYSINQLNLSLSASYVGDRKDSTGNTMDAYTLLDIGAEFHLTNQLILGARVGNVFDKEYHTSHSSGGKYYLGEGRNWFGSINYTF